MILLDTNVLSSLMRADVNPVVVAWLDRNDPESIWTTAISVMEIRYGLELLEGGRQRASLEEAFAKTVERDFTGRVLPFDHAAARIAGVIEAKRRRAGRPISVPDVQIASIALMHNAALATRNTRDFDGIGLPLINPWTA